MKRSKKDSGILFFKVCSQSRERLLRCDTREPSGAEKKKSSPKIFNVKVTLDFQRKLVFLPQNIQIQILCILGVDQMCF